MVPEQERKHSDFIWLNKNMYKLQKKHSGKFIAVVNKNINVGNTAIAAYNKSKKEFPEKEPLMDMVPSEECLVL